MNDCIFCKIVAGEIPSYKIWEDADFIAVLDIFPLSKGMTVIIPKEHITSYIVEVENKILTKLLDAAKKVGKIMDEKIEGNIRTTYLIEGLELDHLHIKLIPFYEGDYEKHQPRKATDEELKELHTLLKTV